MKETQSFYICETAALRRQLEAFATLVASNLPAEPPKTDSAPPPATRDDACTFAQGLVTEATPERAVGMLKPDPIDALSFARVADELLKAEDQKTKVSFVVENPQTDTEFWPLAAFVLERLSELQKSDPATYREPIDL